MSSNNEEFHRGEKDARPGAPRFSEVRREAGAQIVRGFAQLFAAIGAEAAALFRRLAPSGSVHPLFPRLGKILFLLKTGIIGFALTFLVLASVMLWALYDAPSERRSALQGPSLLVEAAYISNPREEASLRSAKYQSALAVALRLGIADYFAANPPENSYFAMNPVAEQPELVKHVIARGETLSGIAERYRVSSASIRRTNSLRTDVLRVGQVLTIPRS